MLLGGWNSGRTGGRPLADSALFVEIDWMIRTGRAVSGSCTKGSLSWTCRGQESGWISYECDMRNCDNAFIILRFTVKTHATLEKRDYEQRVPLSFTIPNYGGKRWWIHCPVNGSRVGKLYCPAGGDIFASRTALRLGYQSQREAKQWQPLDRLFRLQRKLGVERGIQHSLRRPKGMWRNTYDRHLSKYYSLMQQCDAELSKAAGRLR